VVATDAPLEGWQLARVAKRAALGLGRTARAGASSSGELIVAFSTTERLGQGVRAPVKRRPRAEQIDPLFAAAIDATEEAVLNALCMEQTTEGRSGCRLEAIPLDELRELLAGAGPLNPQFG
jgi:D-aminopeptidase